jgi:threonine dehydrogenase-like Zn-dependent dehydrogenase
MLPSEPSRSSRSSRSFEGFHTHQLPLEQAPHGYEIFQKKEDNAVKVLLKP